MFRRAPSAALLATIASGIVGCAGGGNPAARPAPASADPVGLSCTVQNFVDTDGNGFLDTSAVYVYVFASGYPVAQRAEGSFEFRLQTAQGERIATWNFDERQSRAARSDALPPGPGFRFELSLLPAGDRRDDREAELVVLYTSKRGRTLMAKPPAAILVGKGRAHAPDRR